MIFYTYFIILFLRFPILAWRHVCHSDFCLQASQANKRVCQSVFLSVCLCQSRNLKSLKNASMYICTCTCTSRASTELCEFIYFKIVMIFRCSILPFARHLDIFPRLNLPKNSVFQVSLSAENAISKHFRESKMQLFTGALPLDTAWGGL